MIERSTSKFINAYVPETNTIYEFYGDYWHVNPKVFDSNKINKKCNIAFKELYAATLEKEKMLKKLDIILFQFGKVII